MQQIGYCAISIIIIVRPAVRVKKNHGFVSDAGKSPATRPQRNTKKSTSLTYFLAGGTVAFAPITVPFASLPGMG